MATCLAIVRWPGYQATLERDITFGRVIYDAGKAAACLDRLEHFYSTACTRSARAAASATLGTVCSEMFTGTIAPGDACFFSEECAGGALCQLNDASCADFLQCCPGTCVADPPPAPLGGDCSAGQGCAEGNACTTAQLGGPLTCMAPLAAGAACNSVGSACAAPMYCDIDPATNTGTCRAPAASGGPCNVEVGSASCDDVRDDCEGTAICTRRVPAGASCFAGAQTCVDYASCDGTTCVAAAKLGEPCGGATGIDCLPGLECPSPTYTCRLLPPVNGTCM